MGEIVVMPVETTTSDFCKCSNDLVSRDTLAATPFRVSVWPVRRKAPNVLAALVLCSYPAWLYKQEEWILVCVLWSVTVMNQPRIPFYKMLLSSEEYNYIIHHSVTCMYMISEPTTWYWIIDLGALPWKNHSFCCQHFLDPCRFF